mgnify:CR=1 FL=1
MFPAALNLRCNVYARKTGANVIRLAFRGIDGIVELEIDKLDDYRGLKIGNYQAGVAYFLAEKGVEIVGCDLFYDCTVPFGSGLSSSAAIEVGTAVALCELAGVRYDSLRFFPNARKTNMRASTVGLWTSLPRQWEKKTTPFC